MKTIQQNLAFNFIPDKNKIQELQLQFDTHDVVYNMCLEYTIKEYQKTNILRYSIQEWQNYCAQIFPANNPFYGYVSYADALVVYGALLDLEQDLKLFLNKLIPYPPIPKRFDNPYRSFNLYYANQTDKFLPAPTTITIPIVGTLDLSKSIKSEQLSRLLYLTIGRENNNYYIMLCLEYLANAKYTYEIPGWIGVYMDNTLPFITLSNGEVIDIPFYIMDGMHNLKHDVSLLKTDKEQRLLRNSIRKKSRKVFNDTNCWFDTVASKLFNDYNFIVVEFQSRNNVMRIEPTIEIPGYITLTSKLRQKIETSKGSKQFIEIYNTKLNLQTCSKCDTINPLVTNLNNLNRKWYCSACRTVHETYVNAAQNVLKQGAIKYNQ